MSGLYHVAAKPINKFDLLRLIADVYGKTIEIVPDDKLVIDRSLDAGRFQAATGYIAPEWPELIKLMHAYN
jgi:dTDP-4-dehydrorhamnose reductase